MTACRLRRAVLPDPSPDSASSWPSSFQKCEKMNLHYLSHPVRGVLLLLPMQTNFKRLNVERKIVYNLGIGSEHWRSPLFREELPGQSMLNEKLVL